MQDRCERIIEHTLGISNKGDSVVFAHGHILLALTGTWLSLGAAAGRLFRLDTGSICILGFEREQRVITRWNALCTDKF